MKSTLRIISFVIFCTSALMLMSEITNCMGILSGWFANNCSATGSDRLTTSEVNFQSSKDIYVPPNYGAPESHYGSGMR